MNVLFVTPTLPGGAASGGLQVSAERLRGLIDAGHRVSVLCLGLEGEAPGAPVEAADGARAHIAHGASRADPAMTVHAALVAIRPRTPGALLESYLRGLPLSVLRNTVRPYVSIARRMACERWDLVYADHWLVWEAARRIDARRVLHLHNAEPELFARAARGARGATRWVARIEARRSARYLREALRECDELHLLSRDDHHVLRGWGVEHARTHVFLPAAVPKPSRADAAASGATRVECGMEARRTVALFVGSLGWLPNDEGLRWFAREVLPATRSVTHVDVVGKGASDALLAALRRNPRFRAHGFVEDLEPLYARARCLIAPLLSGSGVKIKILNALVRGLPVVTTPTGVEGFPPGFDGAIFVAGDAATFAGHVDRLMTDDQSWAMGRAAATAYVDEHFGGHAWRDWCRSL